MPDSETTIDSALDNLDQIKSGDDPRDPDHRDPLVVAKEEVDRLFEEIQDNLAEEKIPFGLDRDHIRVALARWKGKNGCCMYNRWVSKDRYGQRVPEYGSEEWTGRHSIVINARIYDEGRHAEFIDTVRHELAHVFAYADPTCGPHGSSPGHGEGWKQWARWLGADPSACHNKKENDYKYWYGCPNGCWEAGRHRRSKKVRRPGRYRCNQCNADCVSWRDGEQRPTEPGVSV